MTSLMACASRGLHIRAGLVQARTCSVPGCTGRSMARSPSMHTAALSQALQYHRISSPLSQRPVSQHSSQLDLSRGSHGRRSSHSLSRTFSKYGFSEILHSQTDLGVGSRHSLDRYLSLAHVLPAASSIGPSQLISHKPVTRGLHMSMGRLKEESKVEETLEAIKEKIKEKKSTSEAVAGQQQAADKPVSTTTAAKPKVSEATTAKTEPLDAEATGAVVAPPAPKKSLKERVVDELKHYYHGLRLFVIDIRVSARLIWKVLKGRSLNRREQKQLVRTTADMFRMVPFLVFIIIPFAEFLLPVAIKLFPGMLPSTFQEADKERDKQRQRLQVKLEMAKFLQDTIEEMAVTKTGGSGEKSVQEFGEFLNKIRTSGTQTSTEEIMKFSKLFEDEITLDNLNYNQLSAICKLLEVPPVGTSGFLRFQLEMKLRQLAADDKMIVKEGLDAMAVWELQDACRMRGMRAIGLPEERLKTQLAQWLDLHLNRKVPTSLLLLSRTLYLPEHLSAEEQIKATISTLPDSTAEEAKVKILEVAGERVDNKSKLDIIKQEEEIIMKEKKEREAKKLEEKKLKEAEAAKLKAKEEAAKAAAAGKAAATAGETAAAAAQAVEAAEILLDKATVLDEKPTETIQSIVSEVAKAADIAADKAEEIDSTDLNQIENILERVAELNPQAEDLQALKEDFTEYQENLEDLRGVVATSGGAMELTESLAAQRLSRKVSKMIGQIDMTIGDLSKKTEELMGDIKAKEEQIAALPSEKQAPSQQEKLDLCTEKRRFITIVELMESVKSASDNTKFEKIIKVLDEDQDGAIDVKDALKVIELLGREKMKLNPDQLTEIMTILHKENEIEHEEKQLKKQQQQPVAVPVTEAVTSTSTDGATQTTSTTAEKKDSAPTKSKVEGSKESQRL